jgi:pimeloyl-ACP methyl ester carboxylesterase
MTEADKAGYYRSLLAGTPKLDVVSIAPARHFVMFDQPAKFAAVITRFLTTPGESATQPKK